MRIIGGKDYYDGAAAWGVDPSITFVRQPFQLTNAQADLVGRWAARSFFIKPRGEELTYKSRWQYEQGHVGKNMALKVFNHWVVFCGKVYGGMSLEIKTGGPLHEQTSTHFMWRKDKLDQILEQHGWEVHFTYSFRHDHIKEMQDIFFIQEIEGQGRDLLLDHKIVTITHQPSDHWPPSRRGDANWKDAPSDLIANAPSLADLQFQKAVDPVLAFQEITQWVGGALASHGPSMVEISDDKVKAHKAGFDQWSFRTKTENSK